MTDVTPVVQITADGAAFAMDRVLSVEITDEAGFESDEAIITLDDCEPQIARPREGAVLSISIGYRESGVAAFGSYVFEELERTGWPRRAVLYAKAADHAKSLKEPKSRQWDNKTVGDIVRSIAGEHGLRAEVDAKLGAIVIRYLSQTEESDQNLLSRLARRIGAIITPKDQRLLVTERHSGKTVSGQSLPTLTITRPMMIADEAYSLRLKPRTRHSEVKARWRDRAAGLTRVFTLQTGQEGPSKTLREVFADEAEAKRAAEAEKRAMVAGEGELDLLIVGSPAARAEAPVSVEGVGVDVDGKWLAKSVTHRWDFEGGGATTRIVCDLGAKS